MMSSATLMARGHRALKRGAELVGGLLLAAMFGAFLLQVFTRYVLHRPLDWTLEVCLITYVWFVFWACAFLLREQDHVAFGLLYQSVRPPVRRLFALVRAVSDTADASGPIEVERLRQQLDLKSDGALHTTLKVEGVYEDGSRNASCGWIARLHFYAGWPEIELTHTFL